MQVSTCILRTPDGSLNDNIDMLSLIHCRLFGKDRKRRISYQMCITTMGYRHRDVVEAYYPGQPEVPNIPVIIAGEFNSKSATWLTSKQMIEAWQLRT